MKTVSMGIREVIHFGRSLFVGVQASYQLYLTLAQDIYRCVIFDL